MHPQHEQQINDRYRDIRAWQAQLDWAIAAALRTRGQTASYWVEDAESLIGRIALHQAGGTFRDAVKFLDPNNCQCVRELHLRVAVKTEDPAANPCPEKQPLHVQKTHTYRVQIDTVNGACRNFRFTIAPTTAMLDAALRQELEELAAASDSGSCDQEDLEQIGMAAEKVGQLHELLNLAPRLTVPNLDGANAVHSILTAGVYLGEIVVTCEEAWTA